LSVTCDRSVVFSGYHHYITEILLKVALNTISLTFIIKIKKSIIKFRINGIENTAKSRIQQRNTELTLIYIVTDKIQ
jgi:hypothetical protein